MGSDSSKVSIKLRFSTIAMPITIKIMGVIMCPKVYTVFEKLQIFRRVQAKWKKSALTFLFPMDHRFLNSRVFKSNKSFSLHASKFLEAYVSKTFSAKKWPWLLICCAAKWKQLIGRWYQSSKFFAGFLKWDSCKDSWIGQ